MARLKEIAEDVGCSIALVSKVLSPNPPKNLRVSEDKKRQIIESAKKMGFERNRNAEFLRTGKNASIGLFLPSTPDTLLANLIQGLSAEAEAQGFPLNLFFGLEEKHFNYFIGRVRDFSNSGIITYMYANSPRELSIVRKYYNEGGSVVMLNPHVEDDSIPKVYIDNHHGGKIAAEHLLRRGCRQFLACREYSRRTEAFVETVAAAGLKVAGTFGKDDFESVLKNFLAQGAPSEQSPLGVFSTSDLSALRVMKAVRKASLTTGRDVLLIGYDNQYLTDEYDPPLTTVSQPFNEAGRVAIKMLIRMMYGERKDVGSEKLLPSLVERGSA